MAALECWVDLEETIYLQYSNLSEIFWEVMDKCIEERSRLVLEDADGAFWKQRLFSYAQSIKEKSMEIRNCVGYIYGIFIRTIRPTDCPIMERVFYIERKRTHSLK